MGGSTLPGSEVHWRSQLLIGDRNVIVYDTCSMCKFVYSKYILYSHGYPYILNLIIVYLLHSGKNKKKHFQLTSTLSVS